MKKKILTHPSSTSVDYYFSIEAIAAVDESVPEDDVLGAAAADELEVLGQSLRPP